MLKIKVLQGIALLAFADDLAIIAKVDQNKTMSNMQLDGNKRIETLVEKNGGSPAY